MGGLGIGGRTAVAPVAALASRVDALRAGRAYSSALRATVDALLRLPAARSEPAVGPSGVAGETSGAPEPAGEAARQAVAQPRSRAGRAVRPAAALPRPPPVAVTRGAAAGAAFPWAAGHAAGRSESALPLFTVGRAAGVA